MADAPALCLAQKLCSSCGEPGEFWRNSETPDGLQRTCKKCCYRKRELRQGADPEKYRLKRRCIRLQKFNLTLSDFAELLVAQDGVCAICGTDTPGGWGQFYVDHDHACCAGDGSCGGCVRGLLCLNCNQGLGKFGDNPELLIKAAAYLKG